MLGVTQLLKACCTYLMQKYDFNHCCWSNADPNLPSACIPYSRLLGHCAVVFFFKILYPLMKTVKISDDEVVLLFSILTFQDSFSQ